MGSASREIWGSCRRSNSRRSAIVPGATMTLIERWAVQNADEGDWLAEACGQAAIAVDNFAEVFHNGPRSVPPTRPTRPFRDFPQMYGRGPQIEFLRPKFWNWRLQRRSLSQAGVYRDRAFSGKRRARSTSRPRHHHEKDGRGRLRFKDARRTGSNRAGPP